MKKCYLGDGAYADVEHGDLVLTTEDGISTTNRIVLEPEVLAALEQYVTALRAEAVVADLRGDDARAGGVCPEDSPQPWETSRHRRHRGSTGDPNGWTIKRHEFPEPPYEGQLEEEWGIYPAEGKGGSGPIALVAGEKNARFILACVESASSARAPEATPAPVPFKDRIRGKMVLIACIPMAFVSGLMLGLTWRHREPPRAPPPPERETPPAASS